VSFWLETFLEYNYKNKNSKFSQRNLTSITKNLTSLF
jgi:hypothetical protein